MNNCSLLQTSDSFFCRKSFKSSEPAVSSMIDVTPVATASMQAQSMQAQSMQAQSMPLQTNSLPAVSKSNTSLVVRPTASTPALRAPASLAFLEVKPKSRRASKKTAARSFFELLIAAASLLFLAMT